MKERFTVQVPYKLVGDCRLVPYRLYSLLDMERLFLEKYLEIVKSLMQWAHFFHPGAKGEFPRSESGQSMVGALAEMADSLRGIGLSVSAKRAEMSVHDFAIPGATWDHFRQACVEIYNTMRCECESKLFLYVPEDRVSFYGLEQPFGPEIAERFPLANDDISEAYTCLALDRGTACVMHLSRVAEVGLRALAAKLDVKPQNDWGKYLTEINDELDKRYKKSGARSEDEQFYAEAALAFDRMRRVWRNPSMHVDKSYSPERAKEILEAVRSFMKHLAARLYC